MADGNSVVLGGACSVDILDEVCKGMRLESPGSRAPERRASDFRRFAKSLRKQIQCPRGDMKRKIQMLSVSLAGLFATAAMAQELKVGDAAPDFTLQASDGQTYSLAKLKGKTVVLAWFPKAFTGG